MKYLTQSIALIGAAALYVSSIGANIWTHYTLSQRVSANLHSSNSISSFEKAKLKNLSRLEEKAILSPSVFIPFSAAGVYKDNIQKATPIPPKAPLDLKIISSSP